MGPVRGLTVAFNEEPVPQFNPFPPQDPGWKSDAEKAQQTLFDAGCEVLSSLNLECAHGHGCCGGQTAAALPRGKVVSVRSAGSERAQQWMSGV